MEKAQRNKLIGYGMMLPLVGFAAYMLFFTKLWLFLIVGLVCGALFYVGLKLAKGTDPSQLDEEIKEDIANAKTKTGG
jgi:uncharacterized membrane protein